jgi:molecular chaperone GrpE
MVDEERDKSLEDEQKDEQDIEIEYLTEIKKPSRKKATARESSRKKLTELEEKLKDKEEEIEHLKKNVDKLKEEILRQLAEKDNLRKRFEKEKEDFYQFALSDLLRDLLGILDNFERALQVSSDHNQESFKQGVEMIYRQLQDLLFKKGVEPIEIRDKKFDPYLHQAFMTEESDEVKEMEVGEELQKGYTLKGRLLRPALVKVLVPKKKENE